MHNQNWTLRDALQHCPAAQETVFAYTSKARKFNVKRDILISQIGLAVLILGLLAWLLFCMLVPQQGPIMWIAFVTNLLFMPVALFSAKQYPKELSDVGRHLEAEIVLSEGKVFIQQLGRREEAQVISFKRGSPLIFDAGTGLNLWRLHLRVGDEDWFFDPSRMMVVNRITPYPRPNG